MPEPLEPDIVAELMTCTNERLAIVEEAMRRFRFTRTIR